MEIFESCGKAMCFGVADAKDKAVRGAIFVEWTVLANLSVVNSEALLGNKVVG